MADRQRGASETQRRAFATDRIGHSYAALRVAVVARHSAGTESGHSIRRLPSEFDRPTAGGGLSERCRTADVLQAMIRFQRLFHGQTNLRWSAGGSLAGRSVCVLSEFRSRSVRQNTVGFMTDIFAARL